MWWKYYDWPHKRKNYISILYRGCSDMEGQKNSQEYGIEDYVHFLGYQKNHIDVYHQGESSLSMSKQEGFWSVCGGLESGTPFYLYGRWRG